MVYKIIHQIKPALENKSFEKKVEEFSRQFNAMGYLTQVEHTTNTRSYVLIYHCPVLMIAGEYPEVCDEDCRIGQESLGAQVKRECALSEGSACCRFLIAPKTE